MELMFIFIFANGNFRWTWKG